MSNPGMRLTKAGKNILAQGLLGEEIHFTKAAFGDADFDYQTENLQELTALKSWKMDLPLVGKSQTGDGTCTIVALCSNFELEKGFRAKEIGVFAIDQTSGEEVLYAYRNAGDEYNFIPAKSGVVAKNVRYAFKIEIGDAENVTFDINFSFAYVSQEDFQKHAESENPHPNIPKYGGVISISDTSTLTSTSSETSSTDAAVISATEFWVNGGDNNLWKISVEDARKILCGESVKLSRDNRQILNAQAEISFDANLFVVEDFTEPSVLDASKIKVTSCVKGGHSIAIESAENLRIGGSYWLSDGASLELVRISAVKKSVSGLHVKTLEALSFDYDLSTAYLYRTTYPIAKQKSCAWKAPTKFLGHAANIQRTKSLNTSSDNVDAFSFSDDGFFAEGYFTLANIGQGSNPSGDSDSGGGGCDCDCPCKP